jgi:ferredoxin/flavodoxin
MRITVFYFSGTGNTAWAVRHFCAMLAEKGCRADAVSVEDAGAKDDAFLDSALRASDAVGLANPIYGATIPKIMREFIGRLKGAGAARKPVCWLNTFGYVNGFGPFCAKKLLAGTGLHLVSYVNIRLCNNAVTPRARTDVLSPADLERRKQQALSVLDKAAGKLVGRKPYLTGIGPYLLAGIFIRRVSAAMLAANYRDMGVDPGRCTRCMACVNGCPTGSIRYDNGIFSFEPACTACFRCYNFCPNAAVTVGNTPADPEIYPRYRGPGAVE